MHHFLPGLRFLLADNNSGFLHITLALLGRRRLFFDSASYAANLPQWRKPASIDPALLEYPTDATRDIQPIPCMSHNDEWRSVPLFEALHYGCTGVEADVWQVDGEDELFVGHSQTALTRNRTFRSLYLNPLEELLDSMNPDTGPSDPSRHGVFDVDPEQTLVLLVDFKTDGEALFPLVSSQLETLRRKNYLTYWDGFAMHSRAITVVGTGNAPFNLIIANQTYRDIFFDAPLDLLWEPEEGDPTSTPPLPHHPSLFGGSGQGNTGIEHITSPADFNATNSYYASLSFTSSIGFPWTGRLTASQLALIRGQIRGAKRRGLKARYWSTPDWPTSLRNYIWETVMLEGADVLNVDDLRSAAALDWRDGVGHYLLDA